MKQILSGKYLVRAKHLLVVVCVALCTSTSPAQTFTDSARVIVPDHGTSAISYINVVLDSSHINAAFGLTNVCVNISHTSDEQLGIYLMSPDGLLIELSSGNGGSGDHYTNTCFDQSAVMLITSSAPPFTGSFVPEHNIGNVNNDQNPNGVWQLIVQDVVLGDTGSILSWSLTFGYSPPVPSSTSVGSCDDFHEPGCICPDSASNCLLLPDMIVSEKMLSDTLFQRETFDTLRVTNSVGNIGLGPVEFIGTGQWYCNDSLVSGNVLCPDGNWSKQKVLQRIHIKTGFGYFDYMDTTVGYMSYHSSLGHHHLHVENWCRNSLRIQGVESDATKWPVVATGNKVSFCLYDHLMCSNIFGNCNYADTTYTYGALANNGLGAGFDNCGSTVQGISVGYSDVYDFLLPGQEIVFDSVCNGRYVLVSEFDPTHSFLDGNRTNDVTTIPIVLKHQLPDCCRASFETDTVDAATGTFQFIDRSTPMPDSVIWFFGDGAFSIEKFPVHTFSTGIYPVKLIIINTNGCTDTVTRYVTADAASQISSTRFFEAFVVPNPGYESGVLIAESAVRDMVSIEIYDSRGGRLFSANDIVLNAGRNEIPLQLNQKGVMFVRLSNATQQQILKLIRL